jgi:hypothetical protein
MSLFNGLFQKKICTINSRSTKMTLKRLGSVTVPDPVDIKQKILATTHLILTEWLQKNMGGSGIVMQPRMTFFGNPWNARLGPFST